MMGKSASTAGGGKTPKPKANSAPKPNGTKTTKRKPTLNEARVYQVYQQGFDHEYCSSLLHLKVAYCRHLYERWEAEDAGQQIDFEQSRVELLASYLSKGMALSHAKEWMGLPDDEMQRLARLALRSPRYEPPATMVPDPYSTRPV
jgi:hypothetical protein